MFSIMKRYWLFSIFLNLLKRDHILSFIVSIEYHINFYAEPFIHPTYRFQLIRVHNHLIYCSIHFTNILLRIFYQCIYLGICSRGLFCYSILVRFCYLGNAGFIQWFWNYLFLFKYLEEFEKYCCLSFFNFWFNSQIKPLCLKLFTVVGSFYYWFISFLVKACSTFLFIP